jgi:hypothetical protein
MFSKRFPLVETHGVRLEKRSDSIKIWYNYIAFALKIMRVSMHKLLRMVKIVSDPVV